MSGLVGGLLKIIWVKAVRLLDPRVIEILVENGFALACVTDHVCPGLFSAFNLGETSSAYTANKLSRLAASIFDSSFIDRDLTAFHHLFLGENKLKGVLLQSVQTKKNRLATLQLLSKLFIDEHLSWIWLIPIKETLEYPLYRTIDSINSSCLVSPIDEMAKHGYWAHVLQYLSSFDNAGMIYYCQKFRSQNIDDSKFAVDNHRNVPASPLMHWAMIDARTDVIRELLMLFVVCFQINTVM